MPTLDRRLSGLLLHPTSLPGPHGSGDFGPSAYHFVDWLVAAGQSIQSDLLRLRQGLEPSRHDALIETVRGSGYALRTEAAAMSRD